MTATLYYRKIHCYRIVNTVLEEAILDYVRMLGGRCQYRLDVIDVFITEGPELTEFLLRWAEHVDHLSFLDYRITAVSKY